MTRFGAAAILGLLASVQPVHAGALDQSYYAREKLHPGPDGVPAQPDQGGTPQWSTGEWGEWSSTCSDMATRTRMVSCTSGGSQVADSSCSGSAPARSQTDGIFTSCEFAYAARLPNISGYACEAGGVKAATVSYECQRSSNGQVMADSYCVGLAKPAIWRGSFKCEAQGLSNRDWNGNSWGPRYDPVIFDGLLSNAQILAAGLQICNEKTAAGITGDCYMTFWYHYGSVGKTGIDVGKGASSTTTHKWPVTAQGLNQKSSRAAPLYVYDLSGVPGLQGRTPGFCSAYSIGSPSYWVRCQ